MQALSDPASPCAAVVAPNVYLQYALGPVMDPQGALCGLDFTGNLLDFGYFAIPYSRRVPPAIVEAINVLILYILDSGAYTQTSLTYDFPVQRPLCAQIEAERAAAAAATAKEPPPLGLTDLAGASARPAGEAGAGCLSSLISQPAVRRARSAFRQTRRGPH